MPEDTSGKDVLRKHIESILDESISSTADLDDYGDELSAYADAVIKGLGLTPTFVADGHIVISGAFSRVA